MLLVSGQFFQRLVHLAARLVLLGGVFGRVPVGQILVLRQVAFGAVVLPAVVVADQVRRRADQPGAHVLHVLAGPVEHVQQADEGLGDDILARLFVLQPVTDVAVNQRVKLVMQGSQRLHVLFFRARQKVLKRHDRRDTPQNGPVSGKIFDGLSIP